MNQNRAQMDLYHNPHKKPRLLTYHPPQTAAQPFFFRFRLKLQPLRSCMSVALSRDTKEKKSYKKNHPRVLLFVDVEPYVREYHRGTDSCARSSTKKDASNPETQPYHTYIRAGLKQTRPCAEVGQSSRYIRSGCRVADN